jgi:hypothetical protein
MTTPFQGKDEGNEYARTRLRGLSRCTSEEKDGSPTAAQTAASTITAPNAVNK